jgi:transposase
MSLYSKRLERGRFVWPSPADETLAISAAQLAYMLDGIDWRNPRHTFGPQRAGYAAVFSASRRPGFMIQFRHDDPR